jgi:hypothetical protein
MKPDAKSRTLFRLRTKENTPMNKSIRNTLVVLTALLLTSLASLYAAD